MQAETGEMRRRLRVVGIMGSGSREHAEVAEPLGRWLAGERVHLLTGGGGGVMTAVSRGFSAVEGRAGLVVGVLPCGDDPAQPRPGYPNPFVELVIQTHLPLSGRSGTQPLSRNHINVLSSDVLIALPGGSGTSSEVELAQRYGRPLAAFLARPSDIPGLPTGVSVLATLAEVQEFIRRAL
jgi:uncharacterized protein (TIGR00725 family)